MTRHLTIALYFTCVVGCAATSARHSSASSSVPLSGARSAERRHGTVHASPGTYWLIMDDDGADDEGRRPAWWVDVDGRVFDSIVAGDARPLPDADDEPIARIHADGSLWSRDGAERRTFVRGDGAIIWNCDGDGLCENRSMRCRLEGECTLVCACSAEPDATPRRWGPATTPPSSAGFHTEPAVVGASQCRGAAVLLATLLMEFDTDAHLAF